MTPAVPWSQMSPYYDPRWAGMSTEDDPRWAQMSPDDSIWAEMNPDDFKWSQTQMIPHEFRWSLMISDDPRCSKWFQLIPDDQPRWSQMIPDPHDPRWSHRILNYPRWSQTKRSQIIALPDTKWSLRRSPRDDLRWFQTHMAPDDPNSIRGLTIDFNFCVYPRNC